LNYSEKNPKTHYSTAFQPTLLQYGLKFSSTFFVISLTACAFQRFFYFFYTDKKFCLI
jgi:hypothetical protein